MQDANDLLQQTYGFSPDDIETNRRAELSPSQQHIIDVGQDFIRTSAEQYSKTSPRLLIWLLLLLALLVGFIIVFYGETLMQLIQRLGTSAMPVIGGIVLLFVLLFWYVRKSARDSMEMFKAMGNPDFSKPVVHAIEGRVELVREETRSNRRNRDLLDRGRVLQTYFYAKVRSSYDTVKISIPEKDLNPFVPQRTYRIFYVEHWGARSFLSAELVN